MLLKALLISIIQGIAEFLPISSSGHILLLKFIFNFEADLSFDIFIHLGTLFSILFVFRSELLDLILGLFSKSRYSVMFNRNLNWKEYFKVYLFFIIAIIPAGLFGIFFNDYIDEYFNISNKHVLIFLSILFLITSFILFVASRFAKSNKSILKMNIWDSIIIGIFQAIALFPGISRSGSTISGAMITGIEKKDSSTFSFLVGIPLILGAFLLHIKDLKIIMIQKEMMFVYIVSFFVSFIVGILSLKFLINLINKGKLYYFSIYLIFPSLVSLFLYFFR